MCMWIGTLSLGYIKIAKNYFPKTLISVGMRILFWKVSVDKPLHLRQGIQSSSTASLQETSPKLCMLRIEKSIKIAPTSRRALLMSSVASARDANTVKRSTIFISIFNYSIQVHKVWIAIARYATYNAWDCKVSLYSDN